MMDVGSSAESESEFESELEAELEGDDLPEPASLLDPRPLLEQRVAAIAAAEAQVQPPPPDAPNMLEYLGVSLTYPNGVQAVQDVSLAVRKGEFVFLVGTTGSGKSSLLKMVHRELIPTSGAVYVDRQDIGDLRKRDVPYLRRKMGVIFQDFRLLPHKTAYENVAFALEVTGTPTRKIKPRVNRVLELVNLAEKAHRTPGQMSGGEQQRVAIARALVNDPMLLIGDEPTGNLDPDSSWDIMQILSQVNSSGTTVLVATHNQQIVDVMRKRVLVMQRGHLLRDDERGTYYSEAKS